MTSGLLAARHQTTAGTPDLVFVVVHCLPWFVSFSLGIVLLQVIVSRFWNSRSPVSVPLLTIPLLLVIGITALMWPAGNRGRTQAFQRYVGSVPPSIRIMDYGYDWDIFGRGTVVLTFQVSSAEFTALIDRAGYQSSPGDVIMSAEGLEACNAQIRRLIESTMTVDASFHSVSKLEEHCSRHLFFDATSELGVFVGFGRLQK